MEKLTNDIRLKIFKQNIGQNVSDKNNEFDMKIVGININSYEEILTLTFPYGECWYKSDRLMLKKRLLISMNDRELEFICDLIGAGKVIKKNVYGDLVYNKTLEVKCEDFNEPIEFTAQGEVIVHPLEYEKMEINYLAAYQYLQEMGLALPYYNWPVEILEKEGVYKIV